MRSGYTTGSCAAAGAKAAAAMMFSGEKIAEVKLHTPGNTDLLLKVCEPFVNGNSAGCMIQKDAGDDPDVTNRIFIRTTVRRCKADIRLPDVSVFMEQPQNNHLVTVFITGGTGIGKVTGPGLEQAPGSYAVNRVPRKMIAEAVGEVCKAWHYRGGIEVKIEALDGEETARKTFNARLGIIGGISILGTTGIVEPMSEHALIKSIEAELKVLSARKQHYILMSPGNFGRAYMKEHLDLDLAEALKCSNFVGRTIDLAAACGIRGILFVSHIGKLIKVAGGIMDTHSKNADARMELFAANAAMCNAPVKLVCAVMACTTTEEVLRLLDENNIMKVTMERVVDRAAYYMNHRAGQSLQIEVLTFSHEYGELGRTKNFSNMIEKIRNEGKIER